jgi:hypothetical protein
VGCVGLCRPERLTRFEVEGLTGRETRRSVERPRRNSNETSFTAQNSSGRKLDEPVFPPSRSATLSFTPYQRDFFRLRQNFLETPSARIWISLSIYSNLRMLVADACDYLRNCHAKSNSAQVAVRGG